MRSRVEECGGLRRSSARRTHKGVRWDCRMSALQDQKSAGPRGEVGPSMCRSTYEDGA